jgi:predicted metal-dependent enzyme (double-stranded beta helix superfamily)
MLPSLPEVSPVLASAVLELIDAAGTSEPLETLSDVLRKYVHSFHSLGKLVHETSDDEVLLHASEALTIYHITLSPGVQYPAHNHLMDALVGIYMGEETNLIYSAAGGVHLATATRHDVRAPSVIHMDANTIHAVANMGQARSGALHVYLGNLPGTHRQLWTAEGQGPEAFDNTRYLAGARRIDKLQTATSILEHKESS